jgi:hypothetical protein
MEKSRDVKEVKGSDGEAVLLLQCRTEDMRLYIPKEKPVTKKRRGRGKWKGKGKAG